MKKSVSPLSYSAETLKIMSTCGCLLASGNSKKFNAMTVGWGFIGNMWRKPMCIVIVRPSRYTSELMDEHENFSLNVPRIGMEKILGYCGSVSGRNEDKLNSQNLTIEFKDGCPIISEFPINYKCRTVYREKLNPEKIPEWAKTDWYKTGDYHVIYFGEILDTLVDEDFEISDLPTV